MWFLLGSGPNKSTDVSSLGVQTAKQANSLQNKTEQNENVTDVAQILLLSI